MVHEQLLERRVVSKEEWVAAREELLQKEKALTRERERVTRARLKLPWRAVAQDYVFQTPDGQNVPFADLFEGRSQLIVYHLMFGKDWTEACASCSFMADGFEGVLPHLKARDVQLVAVSRAPPASLKAYQARLLWNFPWYSSGETDFNKDFNATHDNDGSGDWKEIAGISVFYKDPADGTIYFTYNTFARGLENFIATYDFLDIVPKGRDEEKLHEPMDWVKRRVDYDFTK